MDEFVTQARDGDHDAYTQLVLATVDRLHATAYLMLRDRTAAEDAVQDAYLRAWRDLRTLKDVARFEAWLRRLVVNSCLDHLRRRRRRPAPIALTPGHEPTISDASRSIADRDELSRAFETLSPDHRAIVVLTHFDGLSHREAAEVLDVPIGTVKSRLHHALAAMRASVDADARIPAATGKETA